MAEVERRLTSGPRVRRTRLVRHDERGLNNSVSIVLLLPLVLSLLFLGMQWAMVAWANASAHAAAQEGARAAAAFGATASAGESTAARAINDAALIGASVEASRGATTATVSVRGQAVRLVPGFPVEVDVTSTVPVERLTYP